MKIVEFLEQIWLNMYAEENIVLSTVGKKDMFSELKKFLDSKSIKPESGISINHLIGSDDPTIKKIGEFINKNKQDNNQSNIRVSNSDGEFILITGFKKTADTISNKNSEDVSNKFIVWIKNNEFTESGKIDKLQWLPKSSKTQDHFDNSDIVKAISEKFFNNKVLDKMTLYDFFRKGMVPVIKVTIIKNQEISCYYPPVPGMNQAIKDNYNKQIEKEVLNKIMPEGGNFRFVK